MPYELGIADGGAGDICPHPGWVYYRSVFSGDYGVCTHCGRHRWYENGLPDGVEVEDLTDPDYYDDPDEESQPVANQSALDRWNESVKDWKRKE